MKVLEIYTDGSCTGNPGPGGYAAVLAYENSEVRITGSYPKTTNNETELKAILEALRFLAGSPELLGEFGLIKLYSDSSYCVNALNSWLDKWQAKKWRKSDGKEIANKGMWEEVYNFRGGIPNLKVIKVRGHSGNKGNELADSLAVQANDAQVPYSVKYYAN